MGFPLHEILARLMEEVGELVRAVNHIYGPKQKKSEEEKRELWDELGDIIFIVICLANSLSIDLNESFRGVMKKCYSGDGNRYE